MVYSPGSGGVPYHTLLIVVTIELMRSYRELWKNFPINIVMFQIIEWESSRLRWSRINWYNVSVCGSRKAQDMKTYSRGYTASKILCCSIFVPSKKFTEAENKHPVILRRGSVFTQTIALTPNTPCPCNKCYRDAHPYRTYETCYKL